MVKKTGRPAYLQIADDLREQVIATGPTARGCGLHTQVILLRRRPRPCWRPPGGWSELIERLVAEGQRQGEVREGPLDRIGVPVFATLHGYATETLVPATTGTDATQTITFTTNGGWHTLYARALEEVRRRVTLDDPIGVPTSLSSLYLPSTRTHSRPAHSGVA
ncbi:hypothetical protein [Planotetraspora mira]|uniref:Uncharacterized protein n=1 Tax=Planotetraspora mira TaxID=58121 RepID=A0A8J3U290_9ACTN|nr:hypothetical protein [Planotetraspora mira]GII34739.1 hypothetical protein Pmi06nite_81810 [Planotetraspora mira]